MYYLTAIDPGEIHVGVVRIIVDRFGVTEEVVPAKVNELSPAAFYYWFEDDLRVGRVASPQVVAYESYQHFPTAKHHNFSGMPTPEMIGVIKYVCQKLRIPCIGVTPANRKALSETLETNLKNAHLNSAYAVALWAIRFVEPNILR